MSLYEVYAGDGVTPISDPAATPQPVYASWQGAVIGKFASGKKRRSAAVTVEWRFPLLSPDEYQTLIANIPEDEPVTFKTFVQAHGTTPASWVKATGWADPILSGTEHEGEYYGVFVKFTNVVQV